jgi:ketosteroid isomerase-like protein
MHEAGARVTAARALSKVLAHAENHSLAGTNASAAKIPASGIVVEPQLALVMTVRDGKIVRSMDYLSHEDALKAVGLVE